MLTDEEINDVSLIKNQNAHVIKDFCALSIQALQNEVNPRTYISAANKLNVNPIQIENAVHALASIFMKLAEKKTKEEAIKLFLQPFKFPSVFAEELETAYINNSATLNEILNNLSIKVPAYNNLDWRLDILTKTRALDNIVEPVITLQLKLNDDEKHTTKKLLMQVDPNTLIHMTSCLEEALHQARSHHIQKFRKTKKN